MRRYRMFVFLSVGSIQLLCVMASLKLQDRGPFGKSNLVPLGFNSSLSGDNTTATDVEDKDTVGNNTVPMSKSRQIQPREEMRRFLLIPVESNTSVSNDIKNDTDVKDIDIGEKKASFESEPGKIQPRTQKESLLLPSLESNGSFSARLVDVTDVGDDESATNKSSQEPKSGKVQLRMPLRGSNTTLLVLNSTFVDRAVNSTHVKDKDLKKDAISQMSDAQKIQPRMQLGSSNLTTVISNFSLFDRTDFKGENIEDKIAQEIYPEHDQTRTELGNKGLTYSHLNTSMHDNLGVEADEMQEKQSDNGSQESTSEKTKPEIDSSNTGLSVDSSIGNDIKGKEAEKNKPSSKLTQDEAVWFLKGSKQPIDNNTVNFTTMLIALQTHTEDTEFELSTKLISMGGYSIVMSSTEEMKAVETEKDLCRMSDVTSRISCSGRCGMPPDTWEKPGQCGCDHDCYLYGDCCEDLDKACPSHFTDAVETFYYGTYYNYKTITHCGHTLVFELFLSKEIATVLDNKSIDIYCKLLGFKLQARQNIVNALLDGQCNINLLSETNVSEMRHCGRPDVLVCPDEKTPNWYNVFPLHLLCFSHHLTKILYSRYESGLRGMETVSSSKECRHLRVPSRAKAKEYAHNTDIWTSTLHILHVNASSVSGIKLLDFHSDNFGTLRCTGAELNQNLTCEMYVCPQGQLVDGGSQMCYWPDSVRIRAGFIDSRVQNSVQQAGSDQDTRTDGFDLNQELSRTVDTVNPSISFCLCLKANSVITKFGWWHVLMDSLALLDGRCELKIFRSQSDKDLLQKKQSESMHLEGNDLKAFQEVAYAEVNVTDYTLSEGNLPHADYLSDAFLELWENETRRCKDEDDSLLSWCFAGEEATENYQTCFYWSSALDRNSRLINPDLTSEAVCFQHPLTDARFVFLMYLGLTKLRDFSIL